MIQTKMIYSMAEKPAFSDYALDYQINKFIDENSKYSIIDIKLSMSESHSMALIIYETKPKKNKSVE
jgi:hypothetical protein